MLSFPLRERGLKSMDKVKFRNGKGSFPLRERGLKSNGRVELEHIHFVVPLAGTWIEIKECIAEKLKVSSFPLRERGLKSKKL